MKYVINLEKVTNSDVATVGGKNASLGEMISHLSQQKVKVPGGFATTTQAYYEFLAQNQLDQKIQHLLAQIDFKNLSTLKKVSSAIRRLINKTPFTPEFTQAIAQAYAGLSNKTVAVRSSATAEDLANASFAGQQETFLNIKGLNNVLQAIKQVFASLFTSRAIAYRKHSGFDHTRIALSAGIQSMVRSDKAASGVMFTLDTESGFNQVILITASYGLGETIVQGEVNPDEFYVHKPSLAAGKYAILRRNLGEKAIKMVYSTQKSAQRSTRIIPVPAAQRIRFCLADDDIHELARLAQTIENHYGKPMDIEWAKDGVDGQLYIVQARPETVKSQQKQQQTIKRYYLESSGKIITTGRSVGQSIAQGTTRIIHNPKNITALKSDEILVTDMTDPDWEPIMKNAAAIITNRGGRTCHAAIVARELGIPAVVGCSDATTKIKSNQSVTVSCAEGETGHIYQGKIPFHIEKINISSLPKLPMRVCLILGNPGKAFTYQYLPNNGVGLARLEFIIGNTIGIHPNALLHYDKLPTTLKREIKQKIAAYQSPTEFYIERLREGVATIAAAFSPNEVIFRFSDFKSNEYANLLGGDLFEPKEENPMLGLRGASRYVDSSFEKCFELECQAFIRVRNEMGLTNAQLMVPFVRTVAELKRVIAQIARFGLKRGENGLKIYMMCEIPANALLAESFLEHVDGFSIGSNDLTQLTLGLDRDSNLVASLFDERDAAIKLLLEKAISACHKQNKYIGICGQGPSDHLDFAEWLVEKGIQSISLNPDSIISTWMSMAKRFTNHGVSA